MNDSLERLQHWMDSKEGEHFEFKEAKNRYDFEELCQYCTALANEGGGRILLGVTNIRPRQVVGSTAFDQPERTRNGLIERLHLGIDFEEIDHPDGRVLVFEVPSRPIGVPIEYKGIYWARSGDSLAAMSEDRLRAIFAESGHDFSADVCVAASMSDQRDGSPLQDLMEVLPSLNRNQIQRLLRDLKTEGSAHCRGTTRTGRWHPGSPPNG